MSRRRCDFEHRTSIFEGAYRAWSHLMGLDPTELRNKTASELDPVNHTIVNDIRISGFSSSTRRGRLWLRQHRGSVAPIDISNNENDSGNTFRVYPHENLPISGLGHPYIQSILDAWLRPNGDRDAGLAILKTWWNHRRNGQNKSAQTFLSTVEMKKILYEYTSYFFSIAYNLEMNNNSENESKKLSPCLPPPPTLQSETRESDLLRRSNRRNNVGKHGRSDDEKQPLGHHEKPPKRVKQLSHTSYPLSRTQQQDQQRQKEQKKSQSDSIIVSSKTGSSADSFGDVIVVTTDGCHKTKDLVHQIAFSVDGITCVHCITVIETILNGCEGNTSPIDGILSAVADMTSSTILIKIDSCKNAHRISLLVKRYLAMMGYMAQAKTTTCIKKDMITDKSSVARKSNGDNDTCITTFCEVKYKENIFDWSVPCTCSDPLNHDAMKKCERHGRISKLTFEAFSLDQKDNTAKEEGSLKKCYNNGIIA